MTEQEARFIKSSTRERLLLTELSKTQDFTIIYTTPVVKYSNYDAILSSKEEEFILEIKVRIQDVPVTDYDGYVIEQDKYQYLIKQAKERQLTPLYMCIFSTGYLLWDLSKITTPVWKTQLLPKNSQGSPDMVEKILADLPCSEAKYVEMEIPVTWATEEAQRLYNKHFKPKTQ